MHPKTLILETNFSFVSHKNIRQIRSAFLKFQDLFAITKLIVRKLFPTWFC